MTCTYTFNTAQGVKTIKGREAMIEFLGQYGVGAIVPRNAPAKGIHVGIARAALAQAYGDLPDQLERKGLLAVSQTLDDAIDRAAQMRADATGQSFEEARQGVVGSVSNSVAPQRELDEDGLNRLKRVAEIVASGAIPSSQMINLGKTPAVLRMLGASDTRLVLDPHKLTDALKPGKKHNLSADTVIQAIRHLSDPVAVMQSRTKPGDMVVLTEVIAEDGRPMIVVAAIGKSGTVNVVNKVSSVYAKDAANSFLELNRQENRFSYVNNEKRQSLPEARRLYLPLGGDGSTITSNRATGVDGIIRSEKDLVNFEQGLGIKRSANGDVQAFFDPQTGTAHMVADNLSADSAPGVMMHEVGIHMAADGSMQPIFNRAKMLLRAQKADPFIQRVQARLDAAGESSGEEAAAYMVEEYERDRLSAPASVRRWLENALATVKAWLNRKGILGADKLTVADIAAVARANAKSMARGDVGGGVKFSRDGNSDIQKAQILQGEPVAVLDLADAPAGGYAAIEKWATEMLAKQGGKAVHPEIGEVILDGRSAKASLAHGGANDAKKVAFAAVKSVIERGALVYRATTGNVDSYYLSAPVSISGRSNIVTVLVRRDHNTQRMYLHSVSLKENLLNPRVSSVDANKTASERSGSTNSGDSSNVANQIKQGKANSAEVARELQRLLTLNTQANPDIRFSRTPQWQEPKEQPQAEQPPTWGLPEVNKWTDRWDYLTYNLQDRQIDTKRVQQSIEANNGPLPDELNVRQREELFYGRDAKEVQDFKTQELNPMLEQLGKDGIELPEFEEYLHARHAPEANRVMAERNPNQEMINAGRATAAREIFALAKKIEATKDKGEQRILNKAMGNAMGELARWRKVKPYGGSEKSRLALSGMSNQQAQEIMDGLTPEELAGMERSAAMFDAIVAKNRALMVEYGLESRDTVDGWAGLFQHYVPLMREEAEGAGLHNGLGTGQGFSIKGREVKSRTGSAEKKVVDIVANLAMQRERTITRGEKNRVAATMIELARANPNPDFWKVGTPDRKRVYDRATRTVKWVTDPAYKQRDEVVVAKFVKDNGQIEEVALTFNKADPRAMRMATAFKNLDDASLNKVLRTMAPVTRTLAALSTQYNPTWGIFNFARDTFGLMISLGNTPLTGKNPQGESTRWRIYKDAWKALPALWRGARLERSGKEDTSAWGQLWEYFQSKEDTSEWGQLWEDFQKTGGATGFRDMLRTSNERTDQLKTVIDPDAWMETTWGKVVTAGGTIKPLAGKAERGRKALFDWISDFNLGLENASRVATYKAALDQGLSKEQAASIAKNITVNFNRRGAVGHQIGAAYAFFNASVQGTARMAEAVTVMSRPGDPRSIRLTDFGKAVVYGGLALGALQALAMAAAGFEDDEPEEFVRDRNLTIPTGWTSVGPDKGYITLPMPLGYNIIPAFGRRLTEFVLAGGEDPFKHATGMVGLVFDGFNPIGSGSFTQMVMPTLLDPIAAAIENTDSFGRPIARETMDRNIPGHQMARDAATDAARLASRAINTITGGDEYTAGKWSPSPDQLDYVVGQYGGGVAREIIKLWQLASGTARGEEVPFYKVPLLGRFAGSADSASSQGNAYYGNINKIDQAEKRIKGLTEDGKRSEAQAERRKPEAFLIAKAKVAQREVSRLRQEKRRLLETGAERAKVRAVEAKITDAMRRLNEAAKAKGI